MAGICILALGLQTPHFYAFRAKAPKVSCRIPEYSRFRETATRDGVRSVLRGRLRIAACFNPPQQISSIIGTWPTLALAHRLSHCGWERAMAEARVERRLYRYRNPGDEHAFITRNQRNRISRLFLARTRHERASRKSCGDNGCGQWIWS